VTWVPTDPELGDSEVMAEPDPEVAVIGEEQAAANRGKAATAQAILFV
jgi:hypothetical protein